MKKLKMVLVLAILSLTQMAGATARAMMPHELINYCSSSSPRIFPDPCGGQLSLPGMGNGFGGMGDMMSMQGGTSLESLYQIMASMNGADSFSSLNGGNLFPQFGSYYNGNLDGSGLMQNTQGIDPSVLSQLLSTMAVK